MKGSPNKWSVPSFRRVAPVVKKRINDAAHLFGFEFKRYTSKEATRENALFLALLDIRQFGLQNENRTVDFLNFCLFHLRSSKAQLFQDLFILFYLKEKWSGYFVEFGAGNGIALSNTYLLEDRYSWSGIVAEPARSWHDAIKRNRKCAIDFRCVWSRTGEELKFNEASELEFSTISSYANSDYNAEARMRGQHYNVETVSLADLLGYHSAPKEIDYLSIDTEGSEFDILSSFDFKEYEIRAITIEHNYSTQRADIYRLLTSRGYRRVFENLSMWDDWYVKEQ